MNLTEFRNNLNNFYLDKNATCGIKDANSLINIVAKYFRKQLDTIDDVEFKSLRGYPTTMSYADRKLRTKRMFLSFKQNLLIGVKESLEGQTAKGLNKIYTLIFPKNKIPIVNIITLDRGHDFYRMRSTEKYEIFDREGMFNLPFQMLEKQDAERYNKQGYSCLYLANSLYVSWEEMRRPDVSKTNFSLFRSKRKLQLLDITIPLKFTNKKDFTSAFLALICSANVGTDDNIFKFEYLVSNMVLEAMIKANMDSVCLLDGIRYISSKRFGVEKLEFENQTELMYDYVFPSMEYRKKGHSRNLVKTFQLTKGRSLFLYNIHKIRFHNVNAMTTMYKDSIFYELEELVKKEDLDYLEE